MKTRNDAHSAPVVQENQQMAQAGESSRRAFFGKATVMGLSLATGAVAASAEPSQGEVVDAKIRRALLASPAGLTKNATVVMNEITRLYTCNEYSDMSVCKGVD